MENVGVLSLIASVVTLWVVLSPKTQKWVAIAPHKLGFY
jgi:hypothetical protein